MKSRGRESYCICPAYMDDADCQQQRDTFINRIGLGTIEMYCSSLWSMVFWKALVRINLTVPKDVAEYMEHAQYRKTGHAVNGKTVDFKSHVWSNKTPPSWRTHCRHS